MFQEMAKLGPLAVSPLGFGTLSISPLQSSLAAEQGAELLCYAWDKGINFWDTAEIYENYPVLRAAVRRLQGLPVIASKTYAYTAEQAAAAVDKARRELGIDCLDIMLLHEQTAQTLPGHREALDWLATAREKGVIRAVGVSTHSVACVLAAADYPEIDVIHPLYNMEGVGIHDGSCEDMATAITAAKAKGKGIYAMKVLGGGTLYRHAQAAINHVRSQPWFDCAVIGMSTTAEIDCNVALFQGHAPDARTLLQVQGRRRFLHRADWCQGCGNCVQACGQGALVLEQGQVKVLHELCVLCGYCSRHCELMCLKII